MNLSISPFQERLMRDLAVFERQRIVIEQAESFQRQAAQLQEVEHIRKIVELSEVSSIYRSIRTARQQVLEHIERTQQAMEIFDRIRRQMMAVASQDRPMARNKAGATGTGRKSSAKKSAKSSGGDGGGGDGDGDGPQRPPFQTRRPQKKTRTTVTTPQNVAPSTISPPQFPSTPSPPPSPQNSQNIAYFAIFGAILIVLVAENEVFAITVFAILALCLTGHSKVVTTLLTSKAILSLLQRIFGKDGD
ncbi:hypothetical protein C8C89_4827 [Janthinobacterium sp. 75]|nr:hypothetical protein C8C89_4827 [Janthinobacterium sp. 75]